VNARETHQIGLDTPYIRKPILVENYTNPVYMHSPPTYERVSVGYGSRSYNCRSQRGSNLKQVRGVVQRRSRCRTFYAPLVNQQPTHQLICCLPASLIQRNSHRHLISCFRIFRSTFCILPVNRAPCTRVNMAELAMCNYVSAQTVRPKDTGTVNNRPIPEAYLKGKKALYQSSTESMTLA
jgi:hypothetical protein